MKKRDQEDVTNKEGRIWELRRSFGKRERDRWKGLVAS
jgi:hypothetical protein